MLHKFQKYSLFSLYLVGFLFSLQVALPNYVNSSYLGTLMPERWLGVIYTLEAVLAILGFLILPKILRRFGNFRVAIVFLLIEMVSLLGLVFYHDFISVIVFMTSSLVFLILLSFSLDMFLEGFSSDVSTGKTRGIFLTCANLAWVVAPFLTGLILSNGDYWKIYLSAFIILIPVFIIIRASLSNFKDSEYKDSNLLRTLVQVWKEKDILNIFMAGFLLQLFYSWMTIYTPIYLHTNLGLSWSAIGIIFSVMLLPFVFVQFPAGRLADSRFGEKEMLVIGFVFMILSTLLMFLIVGKSLLVWTLILFGTRIGAAVVEIMCDVYFFKKVNNQDANLISFFRMARPLAYIIGPLLATIILSFSGLGIKYLFLILGILLIFGLKFSLSIKDTK
jgi:MFS family permease